MSSEGNVAIRTANVITMNPLQPRAEALAVRGGRISMRASIKSKSAMTRVLRQTITLATIVTRRRSHRSISGPASREPSPAGKTAENSSVV